MLENPIVVFKGKHSSRVYSDRSFVSTSLSYEVAKEKFAGEECCVVEITVSPGSKVLPLRTISEKPEEEEVLLDRDGIMMVTGNKLGKDNMKIIYATYSPEESKLVKTEKDIEKADKSFDPQLVLEAIIESLKDEDLDFLDDQVIKISYSTVTGGRQISEADLKKIKERLGI